ncbi:MAG: tRNA pseudouridine(55) synthase TruB [Proteobacteria bacterium]|nr:tRNA pseudouridine(55) synthase TruB [Pseudomonadota bacterium]
MLIDKEEGRSSFDVVKEVRRILKIKKVGHAGTLDPFATGLLVVLLGQGTKLAPYLMAGVKEYRATLRLGVETDTMDPTGLIVQTRPVPAFEMEHIRETALGFTGDIEQVPPSFSAVKYKGQRAYALARKGIRVALKKRKAMVHQLEIISVDLPDITMVVTCSRGTYMRSLAADLGKALGTGAHLRSLRRLSSGSFSVKEALCLRELETDFPDKILRQKVISLRDALPGMGEAQVDGRTARKIRNGYQPRWNELQVQSEPTELDEWDMKVVKGSDLVALMKVGRDSHGGEVRSRVTRVFSEDSQGVFGL